MITEPAADERLDAIRLLMERASVYRAISSQSALVGGGLSLATSAAMLLWQARDDVRNVDAVAYFMIWALVFLLTLAASAFFLFRGARKRRDPANSPCTKLALRSVAPGLFAGGSLSAVLSLTTEQPLLPTLMWLVFYGVGLLSTMHFAPRSITLLGWAFLLTGVAAFIYLMNQTLLPGIDLPTPTRFYPAAAMGATFGLYHLVYAACAWPRAHHATEEPRDVADQWSE